jgi:hypothetical protein
MAREQKAKIEYRKGGEKVKLTDKPTDVAFVFANGEAASFTIRDLSNEIRAIATVRGLAEKVRDTYAGAETVDEAYDLCTDMIGRLQEGEWMSAREGGGPRMTMLLSAIKEVKEAAGLPFDLEESRAKYVATEEDTDEVRKAKTEARKSAAANPKVAAVLERLKAEAAAKRAEKAAPATATDDAAL